MKDEDVKIIPVNGSEISPADKAHLDIQIVTAKQYPRDILQAVKDSSVIATMSQKISESCAYALPRAGKFIMGPSVHLARIVAQNWTNIRVEPRIVEITPTEIVSHAVCWDLQTNYAVKIEVRKSIIDSYGKRYKDHMITTTGNAANAVSFRNAVFSVIPKYVTEEVLQSAKNRMTGDLSDPEKLKTKRDKFIKLFTDTYGATQAQVLKAVGVKELNDIRQDQIVIMLGLFQSINDGDAKPSEIFGQLKKKSPAQKKKDLKEKQSPKQEMP